MGVDRMKKFSVEETAALLGVHRNTVRTYIRKGILKAHRPHNKRGVPWIVDAESIAEFIVQDRESNKNR